MIHGAAQVLDRVPELREQTRPVIITIQEVPDVALQNIISVNGYHDGPHGDMPTFVMIRCTHGATVHRQFQPCGLGTGATSYPVIRV